MNIDILPKQFESTVLTNGRMASRLSEGGGGGVVLGEFAITRWIPDATLDAFGQWLYVRDCETGERWSATAQPVAHARATHEARFRAGSATFVARLGEFETRLEVCVAPDADVELRRITLVNHAHSSRNLELTTYAELVLNTQAADVAHPAFSKLFVQTRYDAADGALIASRRLRSADDAPLVVTQRLFGLANDESETIETDRMRFIGRGRTVALPSVMDARGALSGSVGNVLDPIFARRVTLVIEPGESRELVLALGAAADERVLSMVAAFESRELVGSAFDRAEQANAGDPEREIEVRPAALGRACRAASDVARLGSPSLAAVNGYGVFAHSPQSYAMHIAREGNGLRLPPLPWSNVVANENAGFIVSETGASCTWRGNSRENRLTPWYNDPVSDPHGEALWIRDEYSGEYWSLTPGPTPADGEYIVRHELGQSRWMFEANGLSHDTRMYVPPNDAVKITRIKITNLGTTHRRLALYSYAQLVLGGVPHETAPNVVTSVDDESGAIFARNPVRQDFGNSTAFAWMSGVPFAGMSRSGDRTAFVGLRGSLAAPKAVAEGGALNERVGAGLDPCAAFRADFIIRAGDTIDFVVLLGEANGEAEARTVIDRHSIGVDGNISAGEHADPHSFWDDLTSGIQVRTPWQSLDLMLNGWLTYQNLSCRMWGRSAFYQSGGAFGFRDQLQDSAALIYLDPSITRKEILLHAAHQFVEGDVLHWWHPPASRGIRTKFSDDLLWLPFITAFYVRTTGDQAILDDKVRYLCGRTLDEGEDEAFLSPEDSGESGTIYDHCCRAIDRSLTRGAHGLPLMGAGDWNDGMNRVGREGRGESVWLGFFIYDILRRFIPICEQRGDADRVRRYSRYQADLKRALNADGGGWDGDWYRRAYYDNGAPLGSSQNDECRIDAIAQAWSVLSGAAPAEYARKALDALERELVSEQDGIIRLLTPAFDKTPNDPGYIKGYLPGVRENGGQYTHGALWAVRALAEAGRADRAGRLLAMLSPISHTDTSAHIETYMAEPYVVAADVYGVAPHVGRAGWTWYTGSAGWMYRVALESILGFELVGGRTVKLTPCIPPDWPGFTLTYRIPGGATTYEFRVTRASGANTSFSDSGVRVEDRSVVVALMNDGQTHVVDIALGSDVGRQYEES